MKNFFQHIKLKYDVDTCILLKKYCRETKRLAKQEERLKYLLTCRKIGLTPSHIVNATKNTTQLFKSTKISLELNKTMQKLHMKIINLEIKETIYSLGEIRMRRLEIEDELHLILESHDYDNIIKKQKTRHKYIKEEDKITHTTKIKNLKSRQLKEFNLRHNDNWFVNKTNIVFPEDCKWLLSLGSKFALPVKNENMSTINLIADLEQWVQTITDDKEKETIRSKITNRILTHRRTARNTPKEKFILNIYDETRKFIKKHNDDIIITKSDKGNMTVVLYRADYKREMEKLLEDKSTYKTMRTDPTHKLQRENNRLVTELFRNNYITKYEKMNLNANSSTAPRLYGLPKIHKPNIPLRPISSSFEVPCYKLAKHVGRILKNLIMDDFNIKNSLELKNKLEKLSLEKDEILISLDVVSLFTNIPIHLAISNIMEQWNKLQNHTKIPRPQFFKILRFCLEENNYFMYDKLLYKQTYGMPMGNPLSPTIADIVLDKLLKVTVEDLNRQNIKISFLTKYVDDLFAIIKKDDEETILKTFNNYHKRLKFTIEKEQNNELPYLDMKLHRDGNKIITDWYAKSIASGRIINYNSTQPTQQKINTALSFITRVRKLSDDKFINKNMGKIKEILTKNSYPIYIINDLIKKSTNTKPGKNEENNTSGNTKKYYSLSYIPKLTENKKLQEITNDKQIIWAHTANKTIQSLFTKTKSKIETNEQSNVVYEIKCTGNEIESCGKVYIGTTKRSVSTRVTEHKNDINKNKQSTALSQHCLEMRHNPDFDNIKILDKERKENKRYTIESLRIQQKTDNTINRKEDKDNISANYVIAIN